MDALCALLDSALGISPVTSYSGVKRVEEACKPLLLLSLHGINYLAGLGNDRNRYMLSRETINSETEGHSPALWICNPRLLAMPPGPRGCGAAVELGSPRRRPGAAHSVAAYVAAAIVRFNSDSNPGVSDALLGNTYMTWCEKLSTL